MSSPILLRTDTQGTLTHRQLSLPTQTRVDNRLHHLSLRKRKTKFPERSTRNNRLSWHFSNDFATGNDYIVLPTEAPAAQMKGIPNETQKSNTEDVFSATARSSDKHQQWSTDCRGHGLAYDDIEANMGATVYEEELQNQKVIDHLRLMLEASICMFLSQLPLAPFIKLNLKCTVPLMKEALPQSSNRPPYEELYASDRRQYIVFCI